MLRRLFLGLGEGLAIGVTLGVACVRGLGLVSPSGLTLALLGAVAGFAVGLVAGQPIWARNAKTEALLKGVVGALGGFGLTFALRHYLKVPIDLDAFSLGAGPAGQLPASALPAVTTALGLVFELDDDGQGSTGGPGAKRVAKPRVEAARGAAARGAAASFDAEEEASDVVDRKLEKH